MNEAESLQTMADLVLEVEYWKTEAEKQQEVIDQYKLTVKSFIGDVELEKKRTRKAQDLLRELFYARTEFGNRVDDLIRGIFPDIWERVHKELNP